MLIFSVDGGCPGVKDVAAGVIGGTSQQYPLLMAALGVEAIKKFADTGEKPGVTEGKNFYDTGVALITDNRSMACRRSRRRKAWKSAGVDPCAISLKRSNRHEGRPTWPPFP